MYWPHRANSAVKLKLWKATLIFGAGVLFSWCSWMGLVFPQWTCYGWVFDTKAFYNRGGRKAVRNKGNMVTKVCVMADWFGSTLSRLNFDVMLDGKYIRQVLLGSLGVKVNFEAHREYG